MQLNTTLSPISRDERNKINENWQRIIAECSRLQAQINILSGDVSVEEILEALETAIANANDTVTALEQQVQQSIADNDTATQQAIDNLNSQLQTSLNTIATKLTELETAITNAETATTDANTATSEAQEATNNALTAITNMQNFVNELSMVGLYDPTATYDKNNMVRHEKAVYIALKNGLVGVTPSDDGVNWRLVIRDGVDGTGAVSSVNGVSPGSDGNVQLTPGNIGAASSTDLSNLQTEVTEHLAESVWQTAILLNGWESYDVGYEPKFTVDKHNNLIIKGAIKNGVTAKNTLLFELPVGMRPDVYRQFIVNNNNQNLNINEYKYQPVEINISPAGYVTLGSSILYAQLLSLDEIRIQL